MSSVLTEIILGNPNTTNPFEKLTPREYDVVIALIRGDSLSTIAQAFNISSSTVATFKGNAYKKLAVNSLAELITMGHFYQLPCF